MSFTVAHKGQRSYIIPHVLFIGHFLLPYFEHKYVITVQPDVWYYILNEQS
jgi:hypothetical protein